MRYIIYYKGSKVKLSEYQVHMGKYMNRYPFAFSSEISVDILNNLVTLDVTPLNERSAAKLDGVSPYISKYTRHYRPRDSQRLSARSSIGKNRHWIWSAEQASASRFMTTETTQTGKRYKIALDQIDTRLLNEDYGLTQGLVHHSVQSFIIAFRIVLMPDFGRAIYASAPKYIYFSEVGGGTFDHAEETTYEDFASRHSKF